MFALPVQHFQKSPSVRYRGIFINDEAPALTGWVLEKIGSYNVQFYEKVFELLLRLKVSPVLCWQQSLITTGELLVACHVAWLS